MPSSEKKDHQPPRAQLSTLVTNNSRSNNTIHAPAHVMGLIHDDGIQAVCNKTKSFTHSEQHFEVLLTSFQTVGCIAANNNEEQKQQGEQPKQYYMDLLQMLYKNRRDDP